MLGTQATTTSIFLTNNTIGNFFIASSNTKTSRCFVAVNEFHLVVPPGETVELLTLQNEGKGTELQTHSPAADDTFILNWCSSDISKQTLDNLNIRWLDEVLLKTANQKKKKANSENLSFGDFTNP